MTFEEQIDLREEHYKHLLSPFEEFLPGMRPSNSDVYLKQLASSMRDSGLTEDSALYRILTDHPFELDKAHVESLVHDIFSGSDNVSVPTLTPSQQKAYAQREFFERRYHLRRNEVLGITEYRESKRFHTRWLPVDEQAISSMGINAQEEGIELWDKDVIRYLKSDRVCPYNPFDDFIASLPKWDKRPRIDKLFRRIPVDDELWYPLAHTWFLGMVALWMGVNPHKGNETMLVLVGSQGVGKSTFARQLLPRTMEPYYTEHFSLDSQRNAALALGRYGLINFDEMDRLTERQQPVLKNMLQLPAVDELKRYAQHVTRQQRYASLMGTSNNMGIIADLTGSRRYLCAKVTGPINTRKGINHQQLFAEAVQEIKDGRRYWLDEADEKGLMSRNARFVRMPADAETFDTLFDIVPAGTAGAQWLYATQINQLLHPTQHKPMTHTELCRFKSLMVQQGAVTRRANGGIQYLVRRKEAAAEEVIHAENP